MCRPQADQLTKFCNYSVSVVSLFIGQSINLTGTLILDLKIVFLPHCLADLRSERVETLSFSITISKSWGERPQVMLLALLSYYFSFPDDLLKSDPQVASGVAPASSGDEINLNYSEA